MDQAKSFNYQELKAITTKSALKDLMNTCKVYEGNNGSNKLYANPKLWNSIFVPNPVDAVISCIPVTFAFLNGDFHKALTIDIDNNTDTDVLSQGINNFIEKFNNEYKLAFNEENKDSMLEILKSYSLIAAEDGKAQEFNDFVKTVNEKLSNIMNKLSQDTPLTDEAVRNDILDNLSDILILEQFQHFDTNKERFIKAYQNIVPMKIALHDNSMVNETSYNEGEIRDNVVVKIVNGSLYDSLKNDIMEADAIKDSGKQADAIKKIQGTVSALLIKLDTELSFLKEEDGIFSELKIKLTEEVMPVLEILTEDRDALNEEFLDNIFQNAELKEICDKIIGTSTAQGFPRNSGSSLTESHQK